MRSNKNSERGKSPLGQIWRVPYLVDRWFECIRGKNPLGQIWQCHIWWIDGLSAFNWKKRVVVIA